jgi:hypothetical protein
MPLTPPDQAPLAAPPQVRRSVFLTAPEGLDPTSVFVAVQYIDPFAPLPIGASQAGVVATLTGTGVPSGQSAYAQLLENNTPIGYGASTTVTLVRVLNAFPLAPGQSYVLQVQFGAQGQNPADLDWSNAQNVASAPVVVQQLRVKSVVVATTGLTFTWEIPGGAQIGGAFLELVNLTANSLTGKNYLGTSATGSVTVSFTAGVDYAVRISGVQPIAGGSAGNFQAPYTVGPSSAPMAIPTAAPTIDTIYFDGSSLSVTWTAPAAPSGVAPATTHYDMLLLSEGAVALRAPAGPNGCHTVVDAIGLVQGPSVAGRVNYGDFVGPTGAALAAQIAVPELMSVALSASGLDATISATFAAPVALSASLSLSASLWVNGVVTPKTATSAPATFTWTGVSLSANSYYQLGAEIVFASGEQTSTGPSTPILTLPLVRPQIVAAIYDGAYITLDVDFTPGVAVDAYRVSLSDGANTHVYAAGPTLPVVFPYDLDVSKPWTVAVQPTMGVVTGVAAVAVDVALPQIQAPAFTVVDYDGAALHLSWSKATLPYLTGYQITLTPSATAAVAYLVGPETSLSLPLDPATAAGAVVSVAGVSPLRNTAASAAVAVVAAIVSMRKITVTSTEVVAEWVVDSAYSVRGELLCGETVVGAPPNATTAGVAFPIPNTLDLPNRLRARAYSGVASGPYSSTSDLLLQAPRLIFGRLGDNEMDLRWSVLGAFEPNNFRLTAATEATFAVNGSAYRGPAVDAFFAAGTLTIVGYKEMAETPALAIPVTEPIAVTSGQYDGATLSVAFNAPSVVSGNVYWLDVLADGGLIARRSIVASGPALDQPLRIAAELPRGGAVFVRLAGVGPINLAPSNAPAPIPSAAPKLLFAAFDGATLHVAWTPVPGPGIDGYIVSIAGADPAIADTSVVGADSASVAIPTGGGLSYPFAPGVTVCVRAASWRSDAPLIQGEPSAALAPTLTGYAYGVGVVAAGDPPYVFRAGVYQRLTDVTGQAITLYLPTPFAGVGAPTVPPGEGQIFQLSPAPSGSTLPYKLTIGADVWTTLGASAVRSDLRSSYIAFLNAVESVDQGVYPWAIGLIRQIIAEAMPQTFQETLYYRYGLWRDDALRVFDLTPGARLQVSNALYQSIVGGTSEKNGFLALGGETFDISAVIPQGGGGALPAGVQRSLSVDAFLSLIYPGGDPVAGGVVAAGAIDFFTGDNRQAYYRVFYPPSMFGSGSNGSTAPTSNVALIGAATWRILSDVTDYYAQTGAFPTTANYVSAYFRGRAAMTPLVNVTIQGEQRWAPLGATVRQLLAAQGLAPYFGGDGGAAVEMRRASANLFPYPTPGAGLSLDPVDLANTDLNGASPSCWPLDMPVVGGDSVTLRQI